MSTAKPVEKHQITVPTEVGRQPDIAARRDWMEACRGLGAEIWQTEGGGTAAIERERESWAERF